MRNNIETDIPPTGRLSVNANQHAIKSDTLTGCYRAIQVCVVRWLAIFNNMGRCLECIQIFFWILHFSYFRGLFVVRSFHLFSFFFQGFVRIRASRTVFFFALLCFLLLCNIYLRAIEFAHVTLKSAISV